MSQPKPKPESIEIPAFTIDFEECKTCKGTGIRDVHCGDHMCDGKHECWDCETRGWRPTEDAMPFLKFIREWVSRKY